MDSRKNVEMIRQNGLFCNLVIEDALEKKIRYLCDKIHNIEWSGILFCDHTGSFKENNMTIIAKDLILLDIGNGVATSFDCSDPDIISYMADNDLLDCTLNLIHSHHSMGTSPSGTDMDTLEKEGNDRNVFVSLIVNNSGDYTAMMSVQVNSDITVNPKYKGFNDAIDEGTPFSLKQSSIYWNFANITKSNNLKYPEYDDIKERIDYIYSKQKTNIIAYNNYFDIDEPNLFSDFVYNDINIKNTKTDSITPTVNKALLQLITGNLCVNVRSNINLASFDMEKKFDTAFDGFGDFCEFAELMGNYIYDKCDYNSDFIEQLVDELSKLKLNKYVEYYITMFSSYYL